MDNKARDQITICASANKLYLYKAQVTFHLARDEDEIALPVSRVWDNI